MKAANILETIGNTPHIRLNRLFDGKAEVWIKSERSNPAASIKDRIAKRRHKSEPPLSPRQQRRNDLIARHRAPVEGVFSQMKRFYGWSRTRCHTLARNAADLFAILTVFNLKRAVQLLAT